jgi:hypothetical protein
LRLGGKIMKGFALPAIAIGLLASLLTATSYAAANNGRKKAATLASTNQALRYAAAKTATGKQLHGTAPGQIGAGPAERPETYAVVQVGDELQVVTKSEADSLKKNKSAEYKTAMKAYTDAKRATGKSKDKTSIPKPPDKHSFAVVVLRTSIKTQGEAETYKAKLEKERARKSGAAKKSVAP